MANATEPECEAKPSWGVPVGIALSTVASIGINIGQNLQAAGISKLPEAERSKPFQSKIWRVGMALFVSFSIVNFAALALAPSSILTPIESIQFVSNIAYNKFVNKAVISNKMILGVCLALVGTVLSVLFGAQGSECNSVAQLEGYWAQPAWLGYFIVSLTIAGVAWIAHARYARLAAQRVSAGTAPQHTILRPVLFTISSALAGGAQMIVHSKAFSTLLMMLTQGDTSIFTSSWILYVEVVLVVLCGIIWVYRQTQVAAAAAAHALSLTHSHTHASPS